MLKIKFIKDYALNLIASFLPLFILQFLIQPLIAKDVSQEVLGLMITLTGMLNMAKGIFGNTLNNIRQLSDKEYKEHEIEGDFQPLLMGNLICSFIFMLVITLVYAPQFNVFNLMLLCLTSMLWSAAEYLRVYYYLILDFKKILISSLMLSLGYIIGLLVYNQTQMWEYVFLFGGIFQFIYILVTSKLAKEKFVCTMLFRKTTKQFVTLFLASCVSTSISYFDRLFIYPLMSGNESTLYYVATLIGKTASLALSPAASVLLAYLVKIDNINAVLFKKMTIIIVILAVPFYFVFYYSNFILLPILYPDYMQSVLPYLQVTAFIAVFETVKLIYNPILLRFTNMKVVLFLNILNLCMYISLGVMLIEGNGLMGYCYAILITNIVIAGLYIYFPYKNVVGFRTEEKAHE